MAEAEQPSPSTVYLIRLSHAHETFRKPELESIASLLGIDLEFLDYRPDTPYCIVRLPFKNSAQHDLARQFISHSILARSIHELYAEGTDYDDLHSNIRALPRSTWTPYRPVTFKFSIDTFCGKRNTTQQREIVEGFGYLPFEGRIRMNKPEEEFVVFEEWKLLTPEEHSALSSEGGSREEVAASTVVGDGEGEMRNTAVLSERKPRRLFFGRFIGESRRDLIIKHDLKKRPYISTTSMDAELALITANLSKAEAGKLFLDPFTGTGGFMVAAAELGAVVLGADIDGRSFRGKGAGLVKGVGANFEKYGTTGHFGDCLTADLTNSPFRVRTLPDRRNRRWLDGIICDPPYGVREGLKVLGRRQHGSSSGDGTPTNGRAIHTGPYFVDGVPSHTLPGFIAPKRPYSFNRMLDDILNFAAQTLVDGGRLAFWMPCANDADEDFPIPQHKGDVLELKHSCVQVFNKWSRRLLVYERLPGDVLDDCFDDLAKLSINGDGHKADELNQFRRMYFKGFAAEIPKVDHG